MSEPIRTTMIIVPRQIHKMLAKLQTAFDENEIDEQELETKWFETIGKYLPRYAHNKEYIIVSEGDPNIKEVIGTLH